MPVPIKKVALVGGGFARGSGLTGQVGQVTGSCRGYAVHAYAAAGGLVGGPGHGF